MLNLQVGQCQEDEVKDQEMMNSRVDAVVVVAGNCRVELGIVGGGVVVEGTFWFWNDFVFVM